MGKKLSMILIVFFAATSLTLSAEKIKLPDYEKWSVYKHENSYLYTTRVKGRVVDLSFYQYRDPESYNFLDLIENTDGKPWLIMYKGYLFQRKRRLIFFGHKWEHIDTFPQKEEGKRKEWINEIIAFQERNQLFFLTQ